MLTKLRRAAVGAAPASALTFSVLAPTVATAADDSQVKCSIGRCTQVTNGGKAQIRVVAGTAEARDFGQCSWDNSAWCRIRYANAGQRTYSGWDTDAFGVPNNCKAEIRKGTAWKDANQELN